MPKVKRLRSESSAEELYTKKTKFSNQSIKGSEDYKQEDIVKITLPDPSVISVGQALLILIEHYQDDINKIQQLEKLYLLGATSTESKRQIDYFLNDKILNKYKISSEPHVINDDPTRRYFETHLAKLTVDSNINNIDQKDLDALISFILKVMPAECKMENAKHISEYLDPSRYLENLKEEDFVNDNHIMEYAFAIYVLQKEIDKINNGKSIFSIVTNFLFMMNDVNVENLNKKQKILKLATLGVMLVRNYRDMPLDIYDHTKGVYSSENRGGVFKIEDNWAVETNNFGTVKGHMPVPLDDLVYSDLKFQFTKPSEFSNCLKSAGWVNDTFNQLVHPYSNSISGTILCQLRIFALLNSINAQSNLNLECYIKCFIGLMLFQSGGHTLKEYTAPLAIDSVKEALNLGPQMTMKSLFMDTNQESFKLAIKATVAYNRQLLKRQKLHCELKSKVKSLESNAQQLRSRINFEALKFSADTCQAKGQKQKSKACYSNGSTRTRRL